jgi:hypothetical protein
VIALAAAPAGGMIENAGNPRTVQGDSCAAASVLRIIAQPKRHSYKIFVKKG